MFKQPKEMKKLTLYIVSGLAVLLFNACGEEEQVSYTETIESSEPAHFDTPAKQSAQRIEALNIANTIQNPSSYLGSRIEARGSAKDSVQEGNKRMEEQDKALEAFLK